ncbi:NtaA/DmoA family FMN-dependent monooxygenase [Nesterenkonia flava]|uniref:NtaA/DmoA family FMN-dependent monooxygenase n=1 Tax=Nesterenkonia flava TaxID=469799 RepID=A0ABU1FV02_9MICC|nr:NtaA/DmoA family FMN-dependent monooxygenase [Nesterenkonia flava]MDR5712497.1 NtaA/DmoA family FMN-dependent monooxygenase [Nesterenkonia flava]
MPTSSTPKKELVLGAFEVMAPTFLANSWRHPRAKPEKFASLQFWQDLAKQLDEGGFDFLFFAEHLAYPMDQGDKVPEVVIREAVQFPVHDALFAISGLAAVTERLGFVVTSSTTAGQPYLNARNFGTVDHLSGGRIGWNIVTSDMQTALVRLLGHREVTPHDKRYARADEFVQLCLKQWEGGWSDDDPQPMDKERGVFNDPEKVNWISHEGEFYSLNGYFPIAPSVQRTPTLFQAGASPRGRDFAAKYAECIFTQERDVEKAAALVKDLRARAEAQGRPGDSIKIINGMSAVVGPTHEEAVQLRKELLDAPSREAMAALFMGWSGVNLMDFDPDTTLADVRTEIGQSLLAQYQDGRTVGEVIDGLRETMGGFKVTGTADEVADELEHIAEATGIDGYLVEHSFGGTESYRDFINEVMPRMRDKGILPQQPRSGSLREMLTGTPTPRLPESHPGAALRASR